MKLFISYCEKDGEGLSLARKAKELCQEKDIEAWVWHDDANTAKWLKTDIAESIESSNAMLTIVTAGTGDSEPQKGEWSLADSLGKMNSSVRKKGFSVPLELRGRPCLEFSDDDFEQICGRVISDIVESIKYSRKVVAGETDTKQYQLWDIATQLEKHQEGLNTNKIDEFHKSVWEGYQSSTMIRDIASLAEVAKEDKEHLVHIAIRSNIDLDKFNAKDYLWEPAFTQLGREIAAGEKRFLVKTIQDEVQDIKKSCNERTDELSIIPKKIEELNNVGHMPDVILAPPSMLKSFVHFFKGEKGNVDFTRERGSAASLELKGLGKLGIYLLGGGILSEHIVIFNRSSLTWKVVPNPDTGYALTIGVGMGLYPDKVAFIVGTTVRCIVKEKLGITRIPIVKVGGSSNGN